MKSASLSDKRRGRPKRVLVDDNPLLSPNVKGERLKWIRNLANLSQEELSANSAINLTTLKSWEQGRFGGLTLKGGNRIVASVAKQGVFCTVEWLLYEVGAGPELKADYKKANQLLKTDLLLSETEINEREIILQELMLFRKLNKHAIDYIVEDDGMFPHYQIGDYVAGTKRIGETIKALIGIDCIVITKDGRFTMRNLQSGPQNEFYNLVCTNLHTKIKDSIIYNIELAAVAPIIWHRKKES